MLSQLKLALVIAALAAIAGAGVYFWNAAKEAERHEIEKQNMEAAGRAMESALSRRDCLYSGGLWDFADSKCIRVAPSDR